MTPDERRRWERLDALEDYVAQLKAERQQSVRPMPEPLRSPLTAGIFQRLRTHAMASIAALGALPRGFWWI